MAPVAHATAADALDARLLVALAHVHPLSEKTSYLERYEVFLLSGLTF